MLRILPVENKEKQREYCKAVCVEYNADEMCYAAYENDEFLGVSLFRIVDKSCVIYTIKLTEGTDDHLAVYLLGKAPMNFADLCGIKTAVYMDSNKELARELEFVEKDGVYTVSLEGYFTTPCKRHGCESDGE